jgi:hypothetical protein
LSFGHKALQEESFRALNIAAHQPLLDFTLSLFKAEEMNLFRRKPHRDPFSSKFAHGGTLQVNCRCPVD